MLFKRPIPLTSVGLILALMIGLPIGLLLPQASQAAGALSIPWQDTADSGTAFSSGITATNRASAQWYNPASLASIERSQWIAGGTLTGFHTKLDGDARRAGTDNSQITGRNGREATESGNPGGLNIPIPRFFYARPLGESLGIGAGMNVPYAVSSEYNENWQGRYHAIATDIMTLNFGLALGWQATQSFQLGIGLNASLWRSAFTNDVDLGAILERRVEAGCREQFPSPTDQAACLAVAPSGLGGRYDFFNELESLGPGLGFSLGIRWQPDEDFLLSLSYRSPVTHRLRGKAKRDRFGLGSDGQPGWDGDELRNDPDLQPLRIFLDTQAATNPNVENFEERVVEPALLGSSNGNFKLAVDLPEQLTIGSFVRAGSYDLTFAINWTRWERFNKFRFEFDDGRGAISAFSQFNESFRYSAGLSRLLNDQLTLRAGVAYEVGAVNDNTRSARSPDNDRRYLTFGLGWQVKPQWMLDLSLGGFHAEGGKVRDVADESGSGNLIEGQFDDLITVFVGAQLKYSP